MSLTPIIPPVLSAYRIDAMAYDSKSYNTSLSPLTGVRFKPGNATFFVCYDTGTAGDASTIQAYNLSTAGDISTVSSTATITITPNVGTTNGIEHFAFNGDGTTLFVMYLDRIEEHSLSGAYSGTGTYQATLSTDSDSANTAHSFNFNGDGTKVFTFVSDIIKVSTLSTPYDLSTAGAFSTSLDLTGAGGWSFEFGKGGKRMVVLSGTGLGAGLLTEYALSTAHDPSTATATGNTFDVSTQATGIARDFCFSPNGQKILVVSQQTGGPVFQYSTVG